MFIPHECPPVDPCVCGAIPQSVRCRYVGGSPENPLCVFIDNYVLGQPFSFCPRKLNPLQNPQPSNDHPNSN